MFLARVIGQVVSTQKEPVLKGHRLLLLRPLLVDEQQPDRFKPGSNTVVAVDPVGAGDAEVVLFAQGSSARQCANLKAVPTDATVIGIVDSVRVLGNTVYASQSTST